MTKAYQPDSVILNPRPKRASGSHSLCGYMFLYTSYVSLLIHLRKVTRDAVACDKRVGHVDHSLTRDRFPSPSPLTTDEMDGGGVGNGPTPGPSSLTSTNAPVFPRLRLNRRNIPNQSEPSPIPGPSSQPSDDTQLTPRVAAPPAIPPTPNFPMATPLDTPAARLRALLSKSPNDWSISRQRDPSPSEPDSDFDPPHGNSASASHHESLRQLFTHALRDDTPQKPRVARRNSIDFSEVDSASPRVSRVTDERGRSKQRKSMSDEELEKASSTLPQFSVAPSYRVTNDRRVQPVDPCRQI